MVKPQLLRLLLILVLINVVVLASTARAADLTTPRYLLPVHSNGQDVVGAGGVRWRSELTASNTGTDDVTLGPCIAGFPPGPGPCPPSVLSLRARSIALDPIIGWTAAGMQGRLVYFSPVYQPTVHFALTLFRESVPVAALPIVDVAALHPGPVELLGVAVDVQTNVLVRIYDVQNRGGSAVVRAYRVPGTHEDAPIGTWSVRLQPSPYVDPGGTPYAPAYGELALSNTALGDVRLEISADGEDVALWAFASVTRRDAPSVAIVAPQR